MEMPVEVAARAAVSVDDHRRKIQMTSKSEPIAPELLVFDSLCSRGDASIIVGAVRCCGVQIRRAGVGWLVFFVYLVFASRNFLSLSPPWRLAHLPHLPSYLSQNSVFTQVLQRSLNVHHSFRLCCALVRFVVLAVSCCGNGTEDHNPDQ